MKTILPLWVMLLWFGNTTLAQIPPTELHKKTSKIAKIMGMVMDSASHKPLEFATVSVFRMVDSALLGGQIIDESGQFKIEELPMGKYRVVINYMGYNDKIISPIILNYENITQKLGKIELAPNRTLLEITEVVAERQVFQLGLDKKVFNVDKTNLGSSENATEILRNTPTVEVSFDGTVKIRGSAVKVYINGKPTGLTGDSQAEILDQLPANSVKSIELITNPSAKYDPEGESGIINIVLKKNVLEGFTGSVNASVGTSTWYPFQIFRGGLALNFRNEKINIFSNFSYNNQRRYSRNSIYRSTYFGAADSHIQQSSENQNRNSGMMARVGMDYYFDDYNTLTVAARIRPSEGGRNSLVNYDYMDSTRSSTSYDKRNTWNNRNGLNMTYNIIYSKVFKQKKKKESATEGKRTDSSTDNASRRGHHRGHGDGRAAGGRGTMGDKQELVMDLQYSMNSNNSDNRFLQQQYNLNWAAANSTPDSQQTQKLGQMHQGTMRIDYTHPFGADMKLETGYKGNIRLLGDDFSSQNYDYSLARMVNDINVSNQFNYLQQVHAVYGTFAHKLGKFKYKLGLRLEQTFTTSELVTTSQTFANNYFSFFPTAHVSYELPKNQQIQLGFSRRIQRPGIWHVNPFTSYSDPLNLHYGNPFLQPQYTNAVELSYVNYWKGGNTFMLTGFYKYNTDLIDRLRTINNQGISERTYYNFSQSHIYGGEITTRLVFFDWWNMNLSGTVYQSMQDATNINKNYQISAIGGNVNLGMNFTFKFGMRISFYSWFSFPSLNLQGSTSGYTWNSLSISQKVLKNKGTITFRLNNALLGGNYKYIVNDAYFYQAGVHNWEAPVLSLAFSYRFGKVNVRNSRSKNASRLGRGIGGGKGGETGM